MGTRVLIVDDDSGILESAALALEKVGHRVFRAASAAAAREIVADQRIDVVLSDIYMPGEDGLALLQSVVRRRNAPAVILMTARGSIETATLARRIGAFDYLAKPFDIAELLALVRSATTAPEEVVEEKIEPGPDTIMVGAHPSMVEMYKTMTRIASLDVPILILGESGSGKELVARAIHTFGARAEGPFVPINCGAIPDTLLENELFGSVRGAYTDSRGDRRGALSRGDGGTVFLDEIGDISPAFQVKLLRFLQDGLVTPLGSDKSHAVNVRVVAATHRDIKRLLAAGTFRQDLFFRLAGYEIRVPPLRERTSDIPLLVGHFRQRFLKQIGRESIAGPTRDVLNVLSEYAWPGNVRELEQAVRRAIIDCGSLTDAAVVARVIREIAFDESKAEQKPEAGRQKAEVEGSPDLGSLDDAERRHIEVVLQATNGNQTQAAYILGIERKTLARKIKRMGIDVRTEGVSS